MGRVNTKSGGGETLIYLNPAYGSLCFYIIYSTSCPLPPEDPGKGEERRYKSVLIDNIWRVGREKKKG